MECTDLTQSVNATPFPLAQCSKFILNIRPSADWLQSRSEHKVKYGRSAKDVHEYWEMHSFWYLRPLRDRNKTNWNEDLSKEQVMDYWTRDWYRYNCRVIRYFEASDRMRDLLVFDVAEDGIQKLIDFFKEDVHLQLDPAHWHQLNAKHNRTNSANAPESISERERLRRICSEQDITVILD